MRVQSISSNNYAKNGANKSANRNQAFEANIYSIARPTCKKGIICELAMMELAKIFMKNAIESGKILAKNAVGCFSQLNEYGKAEFILLDKSTPIFKTLEGNLETVVKDQEKFVEVFKNDPDTVKIPLWATENEICPSQQLRNLLDDIFGGGINPN